MLIAGIIAFSLSACSIITVDAPAEIPGSSTNAGRSSSGGKGTIAVICQSTAMPYYSSGKIGALEAGEELGYDIIWTGTPEYDTTGFIACVENAISQKVDGIVIAAGDSSSAVPICQEARKKGIKVVTFDLDMNEEGRDAYAGLQDVSELGIPLIDTVVNSIGEEGEVAVITGPLTNEFLQSRIELMRSYAAEKYPGLSIVDVEGTSLDPEEAYTATKNIMTTYPNVTAICLNISNSMGATCTAIEDAGKVGKVFACGMTTPNLIKDGMAEGSCVSAMGWDVAKWQKWAVAICAKLIEGEEFDVGNIGLADYPNGEYLGDGIYYFNEILMFTPDNINDYDY